MGNVLVSASTNIANKGRYVSATVAVSESCDGFETSGFVVAPSCVAKSKP